MTIIRALFPAFLAAVLIQPFVLMIRLALEMSVAWLAGLTITASDFTGFGGIFVYVMLFAAAFVLVLGLPLFFLLRWLNKLSWWSVALAGAGAAAIPFGLYNWPLRHDYTGFSSSGNWYGHYVHFIKDGVLTMHGWLNYAESTLWFGTHGLVGALVFYWIWLKIAKPAR